MSDRSAPLNQGKKYLHALREYRWLWIVPTVALSVLAGAYAVLRTPQWQASQAFVVRDEATGGLTHQGRFDSAEAMKSFQETILEVARNRTAVAAALQAVGPPVDKADDQWPTIDAIESLQAAIKVKAPRGGEFGKTEVIYLSVTGKSKQVALSLTEAVYQQLETGLAELRTAKASSLVLETTEKLALAQSGLQEATNRLEAIEREVGSDLGELRILNDSGSGDSNLRASLNQLKLELRQARAAAEANQQQERMLIAANEDPENLLATSSRLFDAQPTLRRLNEGMIDAQVRTAELQGKMTDKHPLVISALDTEAQLRRDFYAELAAALRGVQSDLEVNQRQVETLQHQHDATQDRLLNLSSLRARYANLVADVKQRSELVERAQQELASARASRSAADSSSLITRFDTPVVGSSPIGPGRSAIILGGMLGGLLTGLGLVFLAMPAENGRGRRISDLLGYGRRKTDRQTGRRADDAIPTATQPPADRRATDLLAQNRRASDRSPANASPDHVAALEEVVAQPEPARSTENAGLGEPRDVSTSAEEVSMPGVQMGNSGRSGGARRSLLASCLSELAESQG